MAANRPQSRTSTRSPRFKVFVIAISHPAWPLPMGTNTRQVVPAMAGGGNETEMTGVEVLVALAMVVGVVGVVVPVVPGALLVWAAILFWAIVTGTAASWIVFAVATALIACGQVVKYTIPNKLLRAKGVPNRSLMIGGLLAIAGFFVVPVVGLVLGFVLGVYASELQRIGTADGVAVDEGRASTRPASRCWSSCWRPCWPPRCGSSPWWPSDHREPTVGERGHTGTRATASQPGELCAGTPLPSRRRRTR